MTRKEAFPNDADMRKAISKGSLAQVSRILDAGYDPESRFMTDITFERECVGKTALIWAVTLGKDKIIELLLERGADPDGRDRVGQSALHHAATQKTDKYVRRLIAAGADLHAMTAGSQTPLHYALDNQRLSTCRTLVEAGANPGFVPSGEGVRFASGYLTPFQQCVREGQLELVEYLVDVGGIGLFKQKLASGRSLDSLCQSDLDREKLCAIRTTLTLEAEMAHTGAESLPSESRIRSLQPL